MALKAHYFPHDNNARNDPKIARLRVAFGNEGYALYFMLIEMMNEQGGYLPLGDKEYQGWCCNQLMITQETLLGVLEICIKKDAENKSLFLTDGIKYWSTSLLRRKNEIRRKSKQGRAAANSLWDARRDAEDDTESDAKNMDERKEKKSKLNQIKETEIRIAWFEEAWKRYPKRDGKKAALKHYLTTVKTEQDRQNCLAAIQNYLRSPSVERNFIKNGSTFFNNWSDWVAPTPEMMKGNKPKNTPSDFHHATTKIT